MTYRKSCRTQDRRDQCFEIKGNGRARQRHKSDIARSLGGRDNAQGVCDDRCDKGGALPAHYAASLEPEVSAQDSSVRGSRTNIYGRGDAVNKKVDEGIKYSGQPLGASPAMPTLTSGACGGVDQSDQEPAARSLRDRGPAWT